MRKRAASGSPHEHVVDDTWHEIGLRRAPRTGRFLVAGIAFGVVAALVWTVVAESSGRGVAEFGFEGAMRAFALFALIFVGIGLAVASGVVILLDRLATRRAHTSIADRETVLYHDLSRPVSDDPPRPDR